jgi:hypothetical protein
MVSELERMAAHVALPDPRRRYPEVGRLAFEAGAGSALGEAL